MAVDVCDLGGLRRALEGCDVLYHLAAVYKTWAPDPSLLYRVNIEGATTVLTVVPADVTCASCAHAFTTEDPLAICPACASLAGERRGGDDLVLEWVEYAGAGD